MKLSAAAVRRPVATAMVFVALTAIGAFSYVRLRVDLFPEIEGGMGQIIHNAHSKVILGDL